MPFLYPIVSDFTASLSSGSYLNQTDYNLFFGKFQSDFWYGISNKDAIEFAAYDLDENLISWQPNENIGEYKNSVLTYYDTKNNAVSYNYKQFIVDDPLYKTEKILVNPLNDVSSSNLPSGNYILSYAFTRYLAGSPSDPLVIKEISPNKTELKLIPSKNATLEYDSFCVGKILLDNVSPLYLILTKNCPYSSLYENSKPLNKTQIDLIKNLFFIPSDGKFVEFLKFIYEDFIKYSNQNDVRVNSFIRIQGIKTYFSNFLVSNTQKVFGFDDIKSIFSKFVFDRLDLLFANFTSAQYLPAKQYLFNLFVNDYFLPIHSSLQSRYLEKYQQPLKNSLSYGIGKYIPIINTAYIDERTNDVDPLTLLIKLQSPVGDDISIKSPVWISNIGMVPFLFKCVVKENALVKTTKISGADFTVIPKNTSFINTNNFYDSDGLKEESQNENSVAVNKKIGELNVDYVSLDNFVLFSSAELRHNIFKNKMITMAGVNSFLISLETNYSSSEYTYPYYTTEKETLQNQLYDIIDSFDGWESYLYKTGYYVYQLTTRLFSSSSFVDNMDEETKRYDKYNRDSLINNTPEHIIEDAGNDDYLVFLSMVGHYFDNLYLYIKSLPTERSGKNNNTFSRNILQQMLQSFGWNLDASLESLNVSDNYLDSSLSGTNEISADDRNRLVWNRILNTLPLIYKTKGTEECIKLILSCYGIPSTLISIREYGGTDYSNTDKVSYTIEEKIFMLIFKGYREYLSIPFDPTLKTIEFKVSIDPNKEYIPFQKIPLAVKYNQSNEVDWTIGVYKEKQQYLGRAYFELDYPIYNIGVIGNYGYISSIHTQSIKVAETLTSINPDYIVTLGNNTYFSDTSAYDKSAGRLYHNFINPYTGAYGAESYTNRFYPSIGNADYFFSGGYDPYTSFFSTTNFYTFKKGNVQFFVLNSNSNEPSGSTVSSAQATWLKSQISSSKNDLDVMWRIAIFHYSYVASYSSSYLITSMEWPWASWGMDLVLNSGFSFHERLEKNGVPIIVQGCGGAPLTKFSGSNSYSKFKWNDLNGYSIITTKGNYLKHTVYDMFGNKIMDTGNTTLPSCSMDNGSFVIQKNTIPFIDRPFGQTNKYILSDPIPIFNGDIFNVMVRRNNPYELFEYNPLSDLIPTKYDLWIQRKDDGRTIFSSSKSDVFTQTYNQKFSDAGKIYFGNYQNSSSFLGLLDKILLWDNPIQDNTYNDHCNNINSYSFTGSSIPHHSLYFKMNFDYPQDVSITNPFTIVNANEYYSSSIFCSAYNFRSIAESSSIDNCISVSHSVYPYQFEEIPYDQTFTITSYGPNRFKNQKINKADLPLAARLDSDERSSFSTNRFVSPDSNQIGLFADPNDYKNKDIFRYLGDYRLMSLLADPSEMFDDKYYPLKDVRELYNSSGNKRVLYNEMFTLYKFYFDKSIFETVKQLLPARNNILTGILIEPTVLERPKYQYKKLDAEACILEFTSSNTLNIVTSSNNVRPPTLSMTNNIYSGGTTTSDIISADFRSIKDLMSSKTYVNIPFFLPEGPYQITDPIYKRYLELRSRLFYVDKGWIKKNPEYFEVGVIEQHPDWPIPFQDFGPEGSRTLTANPFTEGIFKFSGILPGFYPTGSGYYYLDKCFFYVSTTQKAESSTIDLSGINLLTSVYPSTFNNGIIKDIENQEELGIHCNEIGKIIEPVFSGSQPRYLIKKWEIDSTYTTVGDYSKPQTVESQSLYFYTTQPWNEMPYKQLIYTTDVDINAVGTIFSNPYIDGYSVDYQETNTGYIFHHNKNTFKTSPNSKINDLYQSSSFENISFNFGVIKRDFGQYLETVSGYPRNHLINKLLYFSNEDGIIINTFVGSSNTNNFSRYVKSRQTSDTTVDGNGFADNSLPVQSSDVSNVNIVRTNNVLK